MFHVTLLRPLCHTTSCTGTSLVNHRGIFVLLVGILEVATPRIANQHYIFICQSCCFFAPEGNLAPVKNIWSSNFLFGLHYYPTRLCYLCTVRNINSVQYVPKHSTHFFFVLQIQSQIDRFCGRYHFPKLFNTEVLPQSHQTVHITYLKHQKNWHERHNIY